MGLLNERVPLSAAGLLEPRDRSPRGAQIPLQVPHPIIITYTCIFTSYRQFCSGTLSPTGAPSVVTSPALRLASSLLTGWMEGRA